MGSGVVLQSVPDQHPRAVVWLARDALAHDAPTEAQALVMPLVSTGDSEALTILGDALAAQAQYSEAINAWSKAGAYTSLADAASAAKLAGRTDDALQALKAMDLLDPEASTLPLATFLSDSMNDSDAAAALVLIAISQYPYSVHQVDWCAFLARVYTKEKDYVRADNWYAKAIALTPTPLPFWIARANTARDSGSLSYALDLYQQAISQFPAEASLYYEMSWAYKQAGSMVRAEESIEEALRLMSPANFGYEVRAGQIYENAGRPDKALYAYQEAMSINPGSGMPTLLSFYRNSLKNPDGAISALKQAIGMYPEATQHISWMLQLAGMYRDAKMWSEARMIYNAILDGDPQNVDAFLGLGWVDYFAGDGVAVAQSDFQKGIEANPERGDGYYAIAEMLVREKHYSEADTWFAQAIAQNPDTPGWWIERGNAARSAGNFAGAITVYTQAIQRFPNFASAYYELAWAYRMNNDADKSIWAIEKALAAISTPSEWYFVRAGQIYDWAGKKDLAANAYRQALALNPKNTSAQQGLAGLTQ